MRENRPYGSEGGEAKAFPTPITMRAAIAKVYPMGSAAGAIAVRARYTVWVKGRSCSGL
jgi:hypothetical protein